METLLISANTHTGQRRKENQDAWVAQELWSADKALLAVIDGVGGYNGGEKAAAIAKESIEQYMQSPSGDTLTMLREAVIFANNRIAEERKTDQLTSEMCCVLTAVIADQAKREIYFAHVGDTRLYRYRVDKLQKLTKDHSFVGIREDAGELSEAEAMQHPHRNQILREVGSAQHRLDDEDFMDYGIEGFLPGDTLLLCSDGLTDMIDSRQVASILSTDQSLQDKVNTLIDLANKKGGNDNITVVLLQYPTVKNIITNSEPIPSNTQTKAPVATISTTKKKGKLKILNIISLLLLLLGIAMVGLYFKKPVEKELTVTTIPVAVHDSTNIKTIDREHTAVAGPVMPQIPDTIRLSATKKFSAIKHFTDSTLRPLVLMSEKNHQHFAAVTIDATSAQAGDTLSLADLKFSGFETGIDVQVPVVIKTSNLVFENTVNPFRYLIKPGDKHGSVLIMHTSKQ